MPDEDGLGIRHRNDEAGKETYDFDVGSEFQYLLDWYWDIDAGRTEGFSGPNPISFTDISAWAALTGNILTREDVAIIRKMDKSYLRTLADLREEQENGGIKPAAPPLITTGEQFDAIFGD